MNGLLRRQMVAQATVALMQPKEKGGPGLSAEDADAAATFYDGLLRQLEVGENSIEGIEPKLPDDIRTGVVASYQNMLQLAILTQLQVRTAKTVHAHQEIVEQQATLLGRCVAQNEELLKLVAQLQEQVRSAVALVNHAAASAAPLTDDDTRH